MHIENVEIFSDQTNMPVIRHPGRRFPGLLVQGDTLYALYMQAAEALTGGTDSRDELEDLHDKLLDMLNHYKIVLREHRVDLPFGESPDA